MSNKIILASGSPRRKDLFTAMGVEFVVIVPEIDETPQHRETPERMVKRLSLEKALAVSERVDQQSHAWIVAADTTVVSPRGKILGKPESVEEAHRMVNELQGKEHAVLTGYAVLKFAPGKKAKSVSRVIKTKVKIQKLTRAQIEFYVSRGESMDKAGAYAAQGMGMAIIEKISGSYTNVVGLPIAELLRDLKKLGWKE